MTLRSLTTVSTTSKLPITLLADGSCVVNAVVDATPKVLELSTVLPNVLLNCEYSGRDTDTCSISCPVINTKRIGDEASDGSTVWRPITSGIACAKPTTVSLRLGDVKVPYFRAGNVVKETDIASKKADGVLGLGLTEYEYSWDGEGAFSIQSDGVLAQQLNGFSIFLAGNDAKTSQGSFLLLNGVDNELIQTNGWTPMALPMQTQNLTGRATTERAAKGELPGWYLQMDNYFWFNETMVETETSYQHEQPFVTIEPAHPYIGVTYQTWSWLSSKLNCSPRDTTDQFSVPLCDSEQTFPRLGLQFGDTTFFLEKQHYTRPAKGFANKVELLVYDGTQDHVWILGQPFLSAFYTAFDQKAGVTVYCTPDKSCVSKSSKLSPAFTESSSSSGGNVGVIIVVVVVLLAIAGGIAAFVLRRRKQSALQEDQTLDKPVETEAVTTTTAEYEPVK